jgi:hypothetical protein
LALPLLPIKLFIVGWVIKLLKKKKKKKKKDSNSNGDSWSQACPVTAKCSGKGLILTGKHYEGYIGVVVLWCCGKR